jgi:hypothetical protein
MVDGKPKQLGAIPTEPVERSTATSHGGIFISTRTLAVIGFALALGTCIFYLGWKVGNSDQTPAAKAGNSGQLPAAQVPQEKGTISEKVDRFKNAYGYLGMSQREFFDRAQVFDAADRVEVISALEANQEFRPVVPFREDHSPEVERYFPFEIPGSARPVCRVNILWVYSATTGKAVFGGIYFRSPN